jgi:hypothetical protein
MISTISKQGGRRYPQMRGGWSAHVRLDSGGELQVVVDPTTLHGWLEAAVKGRLHAEVKGRLHANAGKED